MSNWLDMEQEEIVTQLTGDVLPMQEIEGEISAALVLYLYGADWRLKRVNENLRELTNGNLELAVLVNIPYHEWISILTRDDGVANRIFGTAWDNRRQIVDAVCRILNIDELLVRFGIELEARRLGPEITNDPYKWPYKALQPDWET